MAVEFAVRFKSINQSIDRSLIRRVRALIFREFRFFDARIVFGDQKYGIADGERAKFLKKSVKRVSLLGHASIGLLN